MTNKTWLGGVANNDALNAANWSPEGAPQRGDDLFIARGTMDITNSNLAGDTLTVNSTYQESVVLDLNGQDNIKLAGHSTLSDSVTLAVNGNSTVHGAADTFVQFNVNLAEHSNLVLTGKMTFVYNFDVDGAVPFTPASNTSRLTNNGNLTISDGRITGDLEGHGTINLTRYHDGNGNLFVEGSVGAGQTFNMTGATFAAGLSIAHPEEFHAKINIERNPVPGGDFINLVGLHADSYDFRNGVMTLFAGNKPVDHLRLTNPDHMGMSISSNSGGVLIDFGSGFSGISGLPQHHF